MSGSPAGGNGTVRAWDGPTRLFKWLLVATVVTGYLTYRAGDDGMKWHIWNGYFALTLIVFRVLWGFVGSSTARFAAWLSWPWRALSYGVALMTGRAPRYLGHNPLGGWMIVALLVLIASQGLSGLFTVDSNGISGGPFANLDFGDPTQTQRTLSRWHHLGFYVLLGFAGLHVVANLAYEVLKKEPLIRAMVTGRKPADTYIDEAEMRPASGVWLRAAVAFAASAGIVLGAVKLFGGKLPF